MNSTLNGIGLALRIGLLTLFTQSVASLGPAQAYMMLAAVLVTGGAVIYAYREVMAAPKTAVVGEM